MHKKSGGDRLTPKENVLPTRNACISTEEEHFPEAAPAITRRMSAKMLIQAVDTLRAELDKKSGSSHVNLTKKQFRSPSLELLFCLLEFRPLLSYQLIEFKEINSYVMTVLLFCNSIFRTTA
ncbi:hypothetical protein HNQ85_002101 [Anoxybacillus calidus]|uniref:Uncharacterized protein n=1 Tax=[Anoxybacillus] calidus TaxID=575178 RepID=A0A7W0BX18_9BACL|nr:hypothetical protein [Anoxybacillus calidus]